MKVRFVLLMVVVCIGGGLFAQEITYYGGLNMNTISTQDFNNFHISDWETYGLGTSTSEGRVSIPLGDRDVAGENPGILLGATTPIGSGLNAIGEIQYGLGNVTYIGLFTGVSYALIDGSFSLGITPKLGYISATADFGAIELIDGYTPPVIIPEGTFTNGDSLSMDMSGFAIQVGLTPSFQVSDQIGIFGQIGYGMSFVSDPVIKVNDEIEIPLTATGVVKDDFSGTQAGLNPEAGTSGLYFQMGISYKL